MLDAGTINEIRHKYI